MNPILEEINGTYLKIQDYISPPPGYFEGASQEKGHEFAQKMTEYTQVYQRALDSFNAAIPNLSPAEIVEGYQQGCRLLRSNLGGWIYTHFDEVYIPTMTEAIRSDDPPAFLFLQVLARHLGRELAPLAVKALSSKYARTRQAALSVIRDLEFTEASVKVGAMMDDPDEETAHVARIIVKSWEDKQTP